MQSKFIIIRSFPLDRDSRHFFVHLASSGMNLVATNKMPNDEWHHSGNLSLYKAECIIISDDWKLLSY